MPARIVLFGATGYTGRLTAEAMIARGMRPVLAARNGERLRGLAEELGGLETRVADVTRPDTVRALVERGDVLVSTVGPFVRWGEPAVQAAVAAGATYLDSTGETGFIREVFERHGPAAEAAGCGLLTAAGYDWIPGNLAAALALTEAGEPAVRVDVGYFIVGGAKMSGGTRASAAHALTAPSFAWRDGRLVTERGAKRLRSFSVRGSDRPAISVGTSEAFAVPRLKPGLREVNTYLGWFGGLSRPMQAQSAALALVTRVPGSRAALDKLVGALVKGSTGGPDEAERAASSSWIAAMAYDAGGRELAQVHLEGVDGYTFTGRFLAWAAEQAADPGLQGTGALGPVEAFGLERLEQGVADAGISRSSD
ncbi:MAG TPA: saccharopine dehydrogenase NADP-binding domain-containing protein [Solirubrobacteraceae bacterium]|nr:saccharopine dehydrogenase NADP-binding domain-containing protein [Solirubrobacteraceae bacterium]